MRTADSRTFEQSDGTFVTQLFTGAIFYQPEGQADWQPIDPRFLPVADGNVAARANTSPVQLSLSSADTSDGFLVAASGDQTITFGIPAGVSAGRAGTLPAIKEGGLYVDYADFLPGGISLRVLPHSDGFKSFLVLPQRPATNTFVLAIDAPGLSLEATADGTLEFRDRQGAVVGVIPRPFLMDSSVVDGFGSGLYAEAVTMRVESVDGAYRLTLTVDPSYLETATYPVYVDPSLSDFPYGTSTTANDTFASERYPGTNFNSYQRPDSPFYSEMWHGYEPGYGTYDEVYLRFNNVMETLGNVHIDAAALKVFPYWQYYHYQWRPMQVRRISADWTVNGLKWNNRPATDADLGEFDTYEGVWSDINLTGYVQDLVSGTVSNHGVMLHANDYGQGGWKRIVSSNDTSTPDRRPHLTVEWHRPVATPAAPVSGAPSGRTLTWTYDPGEPAPDGTPQSHYWIQVATTTGFGTILRETSDGGTGKWASGASTSWTFPTSGTTMNNGTTYYWRIKVKDGFGESNWSSAASFVYADDARRGEESYYTRVPFDLGGGWRMAVGVHNGELTLDRYLFEIPSYGPSQSLSLSYSSQNTASTYLGTGWSSNLTQHLTLTTGLIYWHRPDGGVVSFAFSGGSWKTAAGHFETLTATSGSTYTVTLKDQTKLVFEDSGAGRLKRIENRFGKSLTLVWNTNSATATDASGRVTNIVISGGLITSVTDSAGRAWAFGYTSGQLTSVTDPASKATTLAYGASGLTTVTRQRSRVAGSPETITWSVAYTSSKVSGVTDPVNASVANTFTYTSSQTTVGLLKQYSGPVRNVWVYDLDALGRVTSTLDPEDYTTSFTYDASSNLTQMVLPIDTSPAVNQTVSYTYDSRGNVLTQTTQLTASLNVVTAMTYNSTNDLLTHSEADNDSSIKLVTKYTYDGSGHLTGVNVNCTTSGTTPRQILGPAREQALRTRRRT